MSLRLFYNLCSAPSRAVYIFLKINNIPFEGKVMDLRKGEQYLPEFQDINPMKEVPVIHDNGFNLAESGAILRYLCVKFDVHDHWYPHELRARAKVDEFLHWNHGMGKGNRTYLYDRKYLYPRLRGEPSMPESAYHDELLRKYLSHIDKIWLRDKPFVTGHQITIADIVAACYAEHLDYLGYAEENQQRLSAWLDRVSCKTDPHYQQAHALVDKFRSQLTKLKKNMSNHSHPGTQSLCN
ncbi:glutathione S-transferase theta-3-like [Phymastichus coffea]|uniref:glutathione S-transferase theta-3-like n=1 Tax=Phymastichus coffea TaxID=108790 RepID=UPI00273B787D|nr:glutathione S-transferase theta-3-like [Phymastichus coffea]